MKLLSGSIETEKCGKTENRNKEEILPFKLQWPLIHSKQRLFSGVGSQTVALT